MTPFLEYKGYQGSVEFSSEDGVLFGKLIGIRSLISYEGENMTQLKAAFEESVDDYLAICEQHGHSPEIPQKMNIPA